MNNNGFNNSEKYEFNSIDEAVNDLKAGNMIIVVDDPDRENEGDLVIAAELVTPDDVNFITREARGILCLPVIKERAEELLKEYRNIFGPENFFIEIGAHSGVPNYEKLRKSLIAFDKLLHSFA